MIPPRVAEPLVRVSAKDEGDQTIDREVQVIVPLKQIEYWGYIGVI